MKGLILIVVSALMILLAAGCQQEAPTPTATPTATPAPTATETPTPTRPEGFSLEVMEPYDESVVNTSHIPLSGTTTPDAVVSVNGQIVEVDEWGSFATVVTLQEGPNIIEVVASDFEGNEESRILTIVYAP